jgi:hypothetical protein
MTHDKRRQESSNEKLERLSCFIMTTPNKQHGNVCGDVIINIESDLTQLRGCSKDFLS